ncbi:hypothetical protein AC249_AIPGENE23509 [Exaiptasia diaphana]|nr:hypothetical protein AC249_AIPGENE23509 [Exaiptasia diaphana]
MRCPRYTCGQRQQMSLLLIEVENNKIYVSGGPQDTKNAIKELKNSAYYGIYKKRIKSRFSCDTYNFVDGSGRKCEFRLVPVECPRQEWHQDKEYFKIERVDEEDQMLDTRSSDRL